MIIKIVNEFKLTVFHLRAQTRCKSEHAHGFTARQQNCVGLWAAGPPGRRGPWAAGPSGHRGPLGRGPAFSRTRFKCARSRCKICLFIVNTSKISEPKRSVKITDRFTCTSANVIYCITCTLCNKLLYIGETGRRLGDRFREHLRDVEKNDKDASKPVARHFNLPNHS